MEFDPRLALLQQVRQGDQAALGSLLDKVRPYIRVIVRSLRHGRQLSANDDSDLIQDVLMQASQSVATFQGITIEEWLGWLRTITVRSTYRTLKSASQLASDGPSGANFATLIVDKQPDPSANVLQYEAAARMALALSRLPEEMQQVLLGRVVDDLDHAELAAKLGRSAGATRMLFLRALRRLREIWQTEFSSLTRDAP